MSNNSIPTEQECSHSPKPPITQIESYQNGYQQALIDFAITDLLCHLETYSDSDFDAALVTLKKQETETLAAILIQALTANLNGKLLSAYLNLIRCHTDNVFNPLSKLQVPQPITDLPTNFPDVEMPRFLYGDRLCWLSNGETADWGIAIGRFYSFAPHCCRWQWCYLIWLAPDSPSSAWIRADIAWEDDLKPLEAEAIS